ncbi:MAG: UDP-N-acetylglucosamine pyrophosphorylase [Flavobacteriales bacterium]|nr:MAG: UDP-N-acetylglucosamine pyrophosphorylase [Flavobacteriales bacterium]
MKKAGAVKGSFFATRHCAAQELVDVAACVWEIPSSIGRFLDAGLLPGTFERISDSIWAEQGAVIEHGASVEGRLVIGRGSVVKRNAVLRGDNIIGRDCLVGNFTEVKNCLFFDGVQMPHFSYAGDSVLGYKAHLGAGAKISNFKSDGSPVDLSFSDGRLKFGAEKFGAVLGDRVEVGCNAVLNPGTLIGMDTVVYPLVSVRGAVPPRVIVKNGGLVAVRDTEQSND